MKKWKMRASCDMMRIMIDTNSIKADIIKLAEKHGLDLVVLFGSQATCRLHEKSDVDIAILSRRPINRARIAMDLDLIFKRDDIEVVDLSRASPTLMRAVINEGRLLYEDESGAFFRWKIYAIKIWMETAWLRRLANRKAIELARAF